MIMRGKEKGDEGRSVRGKGREKMGKRKEWGMEGRGEETTEEAAIEQGKAPKIFDKKCARRKSFIPSVLVRTVNEGDGAVDFR